jgi:hypothetical protein
MARHKQPSTVPSGMPCVCVRARASLVSERERIDKPVVRVHDKLGQSINPTKELRQIIYAQRHII